MPPRKNTKVNVGGLFEADLATAFGNLAHQAGVSIREGLRRVMINAILEGKIPGIESLELEHREHTKWGTATPVFDGAEIEKPQKPLMRKVEPTPRAE